MLAERLGVPEEILEKFGGKCVAEYKYDGERVQAHKSGDKVMLYSRRLENISDQYPDAVGFNPGNKYPLKKPSSKQNASQWT